MKLHKLIYDLSIEEYHGDKNSKSSSQLKDLLDDPDYFIDKHIEKTIEREEIAAFDVGTYFHTGVLEPHKLKTDCVVFPGKVRRGKEWEKFKIKNKGRAIVTQSQKDQAVGLVNAVKGSKVAAKYLTGKPEVSLFVEICIFNGVIYAPFFKKKLTSQGWVPTNFVRTRSQGFWFIVKVRADMLGDFYISDLKSTTGNAKSKRAMQGKISEYQYDLSAALYLDIFSLLLPNLREFWWIFASKDYYNTKSWMADADQILVGRAKYMYAMVKMADLAEVKFKKVDRPGVLPPLPHEREWLVERDGDLL